MARNAYTCDCDAIHHDVVAHVREEMPGAEMTEAVARFYKIMGDATRCRMLFALQEHELCVCDLANLLSMTKSSISHQLSKMKECGIVKCRRAGKEVYYALDDAHVAEILATTMTHIGHKNKEEHHENG